MRHFTYFDFWRISIHLRLFAFCFLLVLSEAYGQSQPIIVMRDTQVNHKIGSQISFLEDESAAHTLEAILSPAVQQQFKAHTQEVFNRPATKSAFWFKITISNQTNQALTLAVGNTYHTWEADFYAPDTLGNYADPLLLGALRPRINENFIASNYVVSIPAKAKPQTYYLRLTSGFPQVYIFELGTRTLLTKGLYENAYIVLAVVGLLLAMSLYNFFLFFVIKDKLYLVYSLYLFNLLIGVPFDTGYSLFEDTWFWTYFLVWKAPIFLLSTWFAAVYLRLDERAKASSYLIYGLTFFLSVFFPLLNLVGFEVIELANVYQLLILLYFLSLLAVAIYRWKTGYKQARFYILAWSLFIVMIFLSIFTLNGALPINLFTKNSALFGIVLEALFFAFALGDKYNTLRKEKEAVRKEKEAAQAKNLQLIEDQNATLEQKVLKKTKELYEANEELTAFNEELQQTQEELFAQHEKVSQMNTDLDKRVRERARQISIQNEKFREYAFANAHKVRAPLSRILGLVNLLNMEGNATNWKVYTDMIDKSTKDLDQVIHEMNRILETAVFEDEQDKENN